MMIHDDDNDDGLRNISCLLAKGTYTVDALVIASMHPVFPRFAQLRYLHDVHV